MRLQDALDCFVRQLEADGRSPHTIGQYRRHIALLGSWLAQEGHGDDVDALGHELLARFLVAPQVRTARLGGPKRATSMNGLRSSMRAFFSYVHAAGWTTENPARLIRRARCGSPPPRGLSEVDQQRLLTTLASARGRAAERDYALFATMLGSGVRLSAALAMRVEDVDLENAEILARCCKGGRVEKVLLSPAVCNHLRGFIGGRVSGLLFEGRDQQQLSRRHAARRLAGWARKAGCQGAVHPHTLRHSFGQNLYSRCRDPFLVQAALGHRSIVSTLVYVHADGRSLREYLAG